MKNEDIRSFNILKRFKVVGFVKKLIIIKDSGIKGLIKERKNKKLKKIKSNKKNKIEFNTGKIDIILENETFIEKIQTELKNYEINLYLLNKENKKCQMINEYEFNTIFQNRAFIYITEKKVKLDSFYYGINITIKDKIKEEVEKLLNKPEGLKLLANYNTNNNVTVKTTTFFNADGTNYYSGGAERYLLDLYEIFNELGLNMDIYQSANKPYFRKYNNINVIGLAPKNTKLDFNQEYFNKQTQNYINETTHKSILHIYSAFQECYPNHIGPSIGISHGISWDNKSNKFTNGLEFWNNNLIFIEGAKLCDKLVSVDTNTANWFQTIDFELGNKKFEYIANYVDTKEFSPRKDYTKKRDKIVITYPRRLYEARGLYITLDIVEKILDKYKNVEFHFVGKGFDEDLAKINEKIEKYPNRIHCYSKSPYEMHEVYKMSDISLIPTQYSEGTSLSCLEAMASGNIVVATRIGGLTDLILNEYNGYLIEPNSDSLYRTLIKIIDNYEEHLKMKEKAIEVASKFNKTTWKEKWKQVIKETNINGSSTTNDLIEMYVKDAYNLKEKTKEIIKTELKKGNLIYIKSEKNIKEDNITGNLLQLVPIEEEIVSKAKKIYIEKECEKQLNAAERL